MKPIQEMTAADVQPIRWVVSDIDGTLTKDGPMCADTPSALALLPETCRTLWALCAKTARCFSTPPIPANR